MMKAKILHLFTVMMLALLAVGDLAHAATLTWTNNSGGNWSVANNWSPNQVPTNSDTALITTPGTYTVTFDLVNVSVVTNVASLTLGAGGGAAGVQTFSITNLQFTFTNLLVTNGGVFTAQGADVGHHDQTMTVNGGVLHLAASTIQNTLFVTNGGAVTSTNDSFSEVLSAVTVANGGVLNAGGSAFNGPVTVMNGGHLAVLDAGFYGLTVAQGGVLDISHDRTFTSLFGLLKNFGTINLTNALINIYNYDSLYHGGLVNQPGGVINLLGNGGLVANVGYPPNAFFGYIVNQGIINQLAGTNSISAPFFDVTQGTITNLSGTMFLGTYQTNLAGTYFAAAGATIQFNAVNDGINFVTPGTPLVLAGSGQFQFISGDLMYPTNTLPNLALQGTILDLGSGFQGGAITNLALDGILLTNTLPVTGIFAVTNSPVYGNFTVASGGVFTESNAFTHGAVTVANGGVLTANECGAFALTVTANGVLNLAGPFSISSGLSPPLTNSGAINISMTNGTAVIANGIVNQAGGQITFSGNGNLLEDLGTTFFVNQGRITQNSGPGTTNTINFADLDNSQGSVSNLSGTLVLRTFQTNLAGTFSAVAGATNILSGGTAATPLVPGTPLAVAGAGQNLFSSGYLLLPTSAVPGLLLQGGTLELGAGFQGGAITNLILGGMTLTNTLPVTGTFSAINSLLYGNFLVASGGVWYANHASLHGALTVASGGRLNLAGGLNLSGPLTNAGTINFTNSGLGVSGGVINQAGGLMDFWDNTVVGALGSFIGGGYLVNQGRIIVSSGFGLVGLVCPFATNSGTITAQTGQMVLDGQWTLLSSGSLNVGLNSATNYGSLIISSNYPSIVGNAGLAGAFNATLNNGYVPTNGTAFNVLSYGSFMGSFNSLGLPSGVTWQSIYGSTNFTLVAGSGPPQFGVFNPSGTNLIFNGTGGSPGSNYVVLTSTNLTIPLTNWLALTTNTFDGSGQFRYTNNVNPAKPRQFFIFKLP